MTKSGVDGGGDGLVVVVVVVGPGGGERGKIGLGRKMGGVGRGGWARTCRGVRSIATVMKSTTRREEELLLLLLHHHHHHPTRLSSVGCVERAERIAPPVGVDLSPSHDSRTGRMVRPHAAIFMRYSLIRRVTLPVE